MNLLYDTKKDVVIVNQLKKDINTQCGSYNIYNVNLEIYSNSNYKR